jgi:hypothetical protein
VPVESQVTISGRPSPSRSAAAGVKLAEIRSAGSVTVKTSLPSRPRRARRAPTRSAPPSGKLEVPKTTSGAPSPSRSATRGGASTSRDEERTALAVQDHSWTGVQLPVELKEQPEAEPRRLFVSSDSATA